MDFEAAVNNIDVRLERVEQFLPTLATKEELRAAVAVLATKNELRATKEELQLDIDRSRQESRLLYESLKDDIRIVAEGVVSIQRTLDDMVRPWLVDHEDRIRKLEGRPQG